MANLINKTPEPLSPKQAGQLKLLYRFVGPFATALVDYAFEHWAKFTTQACLENGLPCSPGMPHVGFLLKYSQNAINMMVKDKVLSNEELECAFKVLSGDESY